MSWCIRLTTFLIIGSLIDQGLEKLHSRGLSELGPDAAELLQRTICPLADPIGVSNVRDVSYHVIMVEADVKRIQNLLHLEVSRRYNAVRGFKGTTEPPRRVVRLISSLGTQCSAQAQRIFFQMLASDIYELAPRRLKLLCERLAANLDGHTTNWEFPLDHVCVWVAKHQREVEDLGLIKSISLHHEYSEKGSEFVLLELGDKSDLSSTWLRVGRQTHWQQHPYEDSTPLDCVARSWREDTMILSNSRDYLAEPDGYCEQAIVDFPLGNRLLAMSGVTRLLAEYRGVSFPPDIIEVHSRSFARTVFHHLVSHHQGVIRRALWGDEPSDISSLLGRLDSNIFFPPVSPRQDLQQFATQVSVLLQVANMQLLKNEPLCAKYTTDTAQDILSARKAMFRDLAPLEHQCLWTYSHVHSALGDSQRAMEYATKACRHPSLDDESIDYVVWLALCSHKAGLAGNVISSLQDSLPQLKTRSQTSASIAHQSAYIRILCLIADLCQTEADSHSSPSNARSPISRLADTAYHHADKALAHARTEYIPNDLLSALNLASACTVRARLRGESESWYGGLDLFREASQLLGIDRKQIWPIEAELIADVSLGVLNTAARRAATSHRDPTFLKEAISAGEYCLAHLKANEIRIEHISHVESFLVHLTSVAMQANWAVPSDAVKPVVSVKSKLGKISNFFGGKRTGGKA